MCLMVCQPLSQTRPRTSRRGRGKPAPMAATLPRGWTHRPPLHAPMTLPRPPLAHACCPGVNPRWGTSYPWMAVHAVVQAVHAALISKSWLNVVLLPISQPSASCPQRLYDSRIHGQQVHSRMAHSSPHHGCIACRGDLLIIGGDLAYPNPSNETYETRFFRPYEAAMPPPPHVMPGALVVQKPDLPSLHSRREGAHACRTAPSSLCDQHASACAPDPRHTRNCRCATCGSARCRLACVVLGCPRMHSGPDALASTLQAALPAHAECDILSCIAGRVKQCRPSDHTMAPHASQFLAIMTGLMAWRHTSATFNIAGGWGAGCCLRRTPTLPCIFHRVGGCSASTLPFWTTLTSANAGEFGRAPTASLHTCSNSAAASGGSADFPQPWH